MAARFYSGPGSIFCSPTATSWQRLHSHTQIFPLRSRGQELFWGAPSETSPRMHIYALCTHMYLGRGETSFRISFEGAFKALALGQAQMTCGRRHLQAACVLFSPSVKCDRASLGLGEGRLGGELRNVFISFPVLKPLYSLGFVSSRQTPISSGRPACFDFASFGI